MFSRPIQDEGYGTCCWLMFVLVHENREGILFKVEKCREPLESEGFGISIGKDRKYGHVTLANYEKNKGIVHIDNQKWDDYGFSWDQAQTIMGSHRSSIHHDGWVVGPL